MGEKGSQCRLSTVLATGDEENINNNDKYAGQEIITMENNKKEQVQTPNNKSTLLQSVNIKSVYQTKSFDQDNTMLASPKYFQNRAKKKQNSPMSYIDDQRNSLSIV